MSEGASGRERGSEREGASPLGWHKLSARRLRGSREQENEWATFALHDFVGAAACSRVCARHGGVPPAATVVVVAVTTVVVAVMGAATWGKAALGARRGTSSGF